MTDIFFAPLSALARGLAGGTLSSREIVKGCLDRIAAFDARLHAFIEIYRNAALSALFERLVASHFAAASQSSVRAAVRAVVGESFGGSRGRYLAALHQEAMHRFINAIDLPAQVGKRGRRLRHNGRFYLAPWPKSKKTLTLCRMVLWKRRSGLRIMGSGRKHPWSRQS